MTQMKLDHLNDVNSVSTRLGERLKRDFFEIIKPYLQQDFSRPRLETPTLLYQATVGTGKTHQMVGLVGFALEHGLRIMVRAPTTMLAEDIACNINAEYPNAAAVWYGRERKDPADPTYQMCPRHDVVSKLISLNSAPELACGNKNTGYCRFHPASDSDQSCGYKRQDLRNKSVVVVAGDEIMTLAPREQMKRGTDSKFFLRRESEPDLFGRTTITSFKQRAQLDGKGDFDLVILDETNPLGMVKGINEPSLYEPKGDAKEASIADHIDEEILSGISETLQDLLHHSEHRYLRPFTLPEGMQDDLGNKIDIFEEIKAIADKYLRKPIEAANYHKIDGDTVSQINYKHVKQRRFLRSVSDICQAMIVALSGGNEQSPRLQIVDANGDRKLNVCTVSEISPRYGGIPFIIFDATPQIPLLETIYGPIQTRFEASVKDGPLVKRFQLLDKTLSYQALNDERWAARLLLMSELLATTHGETGLICPLKVKSVIQEQIQTSVRLNHFGGLRGDNSFSKLPCVIIASRPAKHYEYVENVAAILMSQKISEILPGSTKVDWYPKSEKFILHRSKQSGWPVQNDRHPDTFAECVRATITDDNLEQALGRTRSVRRYELPLHEYILTNVATNRLVDGVFSMAELKAATSWVGLLLHAGVWVAPGKGTSILFHVFRGLLAQRRDSLYRYIIGDPAFETPEQAAKWRKDQLKDNQAIAELVTEIDEAMVNQADSMKLLHSPFPVAGFRAVKAKVRGSRYFAHLYVRIEGDETPITALQQILGDQMENIEVK